MKKRSRSKSTGTDKEQPCPQKQPSGTAPEAPWTVKAYTAWTENDIPYLYESLRVHQLELEMQNEELRQTRARTEELLRKYTDLYEFAPVGYLTLDPRGTILQSNLTAAHILGMERSRLEGVRIHSFITEPGRRSFGTFLEQVFTGPTKQSFEAKLQAPPCRELTVFIEARRPGNEEECLAVMTDITGQKRAEAVLRETYDRLERSLGGMVDILSRMIEKRGPHAPGHHQRVSALASAIARELFLPPGSVQGIELAAAVYDIGLIEVPSDFLHETGTLKGIKREIYQGYPQAGHDALKNIEFPWPIAEIILQHREHFDGSGFPRGIRGPDMLIEARILAAAIRLEELTSHGSHRTGLALPQALKVIGAESGSRLDPAVIEACRRAFPVRRSRAAEAS